MSGPEIHGGRVDPVPFSDTYTVNPDCTYTSEFGGSTQFGIIARHGEKIRVLKRIAAFCWPSPPTKSKNLRGETIGNSHPS